MTFDDVIVTDDVNIMHLQSPLTFHTPPSTHCVFALLFRAFD